MTLAVAVPGVATQRKRRRMLLRGTVQGVGFRPFVYRQAVVLGLAGWVANSPEGVIIEAEGSAERLGELLRLIDTESPAHAMVTSVKVQELAPLGEVGFVVRHSETAGRRSTQVSPDLATCDDCLSELFDAADRRYRYPFINCTHCGPRYSIIESLPYDRARTTMRRFQMCAACNSEYHDPADRRFHAEPNACPECGPRLALWDQAGTVQADDDEALLAAVAALREGRIVAVKGIGGFHLMVEAGNEAAVSRLRLAKGREEKPFAVMFPTLADVGSCCQVSVAEAALLCEPARPIVLLQKRVSLEKRGSVQKSTSVQISISAIAPAVTAGNARLGAMLPYSPLHHLLLHELAMPIVVTSANMSDEPIVANELEALTRLAGVADLFLVHDRPIVRALDDSVAQVVLDEPQMLRRARGYAPAPVTKTTLTGGILTFGGHLKATIALTCGAGTVLSHHLGDLETVSARDGYAAARSDLLQLFSVQPRVAARDLHPDYASSQAAELSGLPVVTVQHHLAHVVACMAEHGLAAPVLGVAWDGVGYGSDGTIWGGEFLAIDDAGWRRVAHLRPFRLPGGEAAGREPARAALGLLFAAYGEAALQMTDLAPIDCYTSARRAVLHRMLVQGINSPVTTSAGRLFDAFAALCGLHQRSSYEGQAAAALEWCADHRVHGAGYRMPLREGTDGCLQVDWQPALTEAITELRAGQPAGAVSASLHSALASAIAAVSKRLDAFRVVLTGGCFQNILLTEKTVAALRAVGCEPFWHQRVPPNDGGIALGQAAWAAWSARSESARSKQEEQTPCA
ncbi:MAG: carbamoyltransferase HypF [Betaproteobacteria bacterium]|nr:MAG: carbamoyltransferase HypF [Betaproteobacteria bacterium]